MQPKGRDLSCHLQMTSLLAVRNNLGCDLRLKPDIGQCLEMTGVCLDRLKLYG